MKNLILSMVSTALSVCAFANPDAIIGVWKTGDGKAMVKVYKEGEKYYGKIVWLAEPNDPKTGQPKLDTNNPDEKMRSRGVLGLTNLRDFIYDGDNEWDNGSIYDPKTGNDYSCTMNLKDNNTLEVRGYVGISLFGRTDTWTRMVKK